MCHTLQQLKEPELLDPLVPAIKECLEHRHSYVRKNAALAVFYIHKVREEGGAELSSKQRIRPRLLLSMFSVLSHTFNFCLRH
jgi:vesicle coat complex subunit